MNQGERLLQTEAELLAMNREQLRTELDKALAGLEDLEELRRGFMGQTGVHIGMAVLTSARRQFEQGEARLKERIALLEELLHTGDSHAG
ncbi:MAG: hypothetical protein HW388_1518 [Dehalococcoidia bacterium]|nr:hypothetical protein [Dehalococcoidia bacterium]